MVNTEIGYRLNVASSLAVDVSAFVARYADLQTNEPITPFLEITPGPPHLVVATEYENLLDATTRGVTMAAHWQPLATWKIDGSYTAFHYAPHLEPGSLDTAAAAGDGNAPRTQWQVRSSVSVTPRVRLDTALFYTGALSVLGVPAYTRADQRVEVTLTRRVSAAVTGQNLLEPAHMEFAGPGIPVTATLIPRSLTPARAPVTLVQGRAAAAIDVHKRRLPAVVLALLVAGAPLTAQTASAPALKAAFVYNFAKFAEWPADAGKAGPLTICVLGDLQIANELESTIKGRTIDGREVLVVRIQPEGVRVCHVLYVSGFDAKRWQQIIDDLKNAPVLTVGDADHFAEGGGIAGLFIDDGRVRFAVNVEAAKRARLQISSRLLSLAKLVKDERVHQ